MAVPRFSFGSGASGLYNPNQVLVPTTLTSEDRAQADKYQAESDAYNKAIEAYKQQAEEYNKALEAYNAGPRTSDFTKEVPKKPADLSFTQADLDAFEAASTARAQQLQAARQNAFNIMQNPEGFSQQYGIGSLGFEEGGEVPVNFVGTGEFSQEEPSIGYSTQQQMAERELPFLANVALDMSPVGTPKAGIETLGYLSEGRIGDALLTAPGMLPLIPSLGTILKTGSRVSTSSLNDLTTPELITSWVVAPEKVNRTEFITELAKKPEVIERSQKALSEMGYGETVPMFRIVKLTDNASLKPESLVSATLDPKLLENNFRFLSSGKFGREGVTDYQLLRYDVPKDRVAAYLPALSGDITTAVNTKVKKKGFGQDAAKGYETVSDPAAHAKSLIKLQDEVLADVSGIEPKVLMKPQGNPQNLLSMDAAQVSFPVASGRVSKFQDLPESMQYMSPENRKLYEDAIQGYQGFFSRGFADGGEVPQGGVAELNPYGIRYSGDTRNVISDSLKGKGYFGELTSPSGQAVTEYSLYDSDIGDYPSIVPTLTREEINDTVMRSSRQLPPSESVVMKARRHAMERIAEGKSPFAGRTELRFPVPSEADQDMVSRIQRFLEKNRP